MKWLSLINTHKYILKKKIINNYHCIIIQLTKTEYEYIIVRLLFLFYYIKLIQVKTKKRNIIL
jgi:hypothetical protein